MTLKGRMAFVRSQRYRASMNLAPFRPHLRVLFWLALAGAVTFAIMPQPPQLPTDDLGDKFNHMLAFSVLSALACVGWPRLERLRLIERLSFLGALIEVVQSIPALHRDCDIKDWIADTLAVIVVVWLTDRIARRPGDAGPKRGQ
jgi:VanZ family protein